MSCDEKTLRQEIQRLAPGVEVVAVAQFTDGIDAIVADGWGQTRWSRYRQNLPRKVAAELPGQKTLF